MLATLLNENKRVNNYSEFCIRMDGEWAGGWISHSIFCGVCVCVCVHVRAHTSYAFYFIHTNADELIGSLKHQPLELKSPGPSAAICLSDMDTGQLVEVPPFPGCLSAGGLDGHIEGISALQKTQQAVSGPIPCIYEDTRVMASVTAQATRSVPCSPTSGD